MSAVIGLFHEEDIEHHIFMFEHMEEAEDMENMLIEEVGVEYSSKKIMMMTQDNDYDDDNYHNETT